jgi:transposase
VLVRQLPADFPPWPTVYWYFVRFEQAKATEESLPVVRGQLRLPEGRDSEPSAGLIDSQTVRGADTVGRGQPQLRRRQEDQRRQADHRHRHPRFPTY